MNANRGTAQEREGELDRVTLRPVERKEEEKKEEQSHDDAFTFWGSKTKMKRDGGFKKKPKK